MREGKCGKHRILFWKSNALDLSGVLLLWEPVDKGADFGLRAVRIPLGVLLILLLQRAASGVRSLWLTTQSSAAAPWWRHYPVLLRSGAQCPVGRGTGCVGKVS